MQDSSGIQQAGEGPPPSEEASAEHGLSEAISFKLPVFEGPLDLLLHLIKTNKIDIYDIPIALITRQYLEYIEMMKELNLEVAGEFLVMAATLIHIKSRMLLPVEETAGTEEEMDPRFELVQKLLEYQSFRESALGLREREEIGARRSQRGGGSSRICPRCSRW